MNKIMKILLCGDYVIKNISVCLYISSEKVKSKIWSKKKSSKITSTLLDLQFEFELTNYN